MTRRVVCSWCILALVALLAVSMGAGEGWAQGTNPFGVGPKSPQAPAEQGFWGDTFKPVLLWVYARQQEFQRLLTAAVKQFREEPSAVWWLMAASFLYGVFHAAGPGHGKAVLSSYMLANETQLRRGVVLAFAAAFVQALSAITIVMVLALLINATGRTITRTANQLEIASYALIVLFGLWLIWRKSRALLRKHAPVSGHHNDEHHHHGHDHAHGHSHDHHDHGDCCGHVHMPAPRDLSDRLTPARAAGLIFAMGLRPCTGAILVLLFALAQGVFLAGIGATFAMAVGTAITVATLAGLALGAKHIAVRLAGHGSAKAAYVHHIVEFAGALLVLLFGLLLLSASLQGGSPF